MDLLSLKITTIHDNYKSKSDSTTASKKGSIYYQYLLWMNEWCIYIALYCVSLYTQSDLQLCVCGGGGLLYGSHSTTAPVRSSHISQSYRLLGALCKTVSTGGVRVVMNKWVKCICLCFTPSRVTLAESARETVFLPRLAMLSARFFCLEQETLRHSRYMIWLIFT